MDYLDREGIFKVRPLDWRVLNSEKSRSVGIAIDFAVVAQLEGSDWIDWTSYGVRVRGVYYVVKKDGTPNIRTCEQLAECLGWSGSLRAVATSPPPETIVQVTVESEVYEGKTRFKAGWMNPENFVPGGSSMPVEQVDALEAQFGSLLRAAASKAQKPGAPPKPAAPPSKPVAAPAGSRLDPRESPADYGQIPF